MNEMRIFAAVFGIDLAYIVYMQQPWLLNASRQEQALFLTRAFMRLQSKSDCVGTNDKQAYYREFSFVFARVWSAAGRLFQSSPDLIAYLSRFQVDSPPYRRELHRAAMHNLAAVLANAPLDLTWPPFEPQVQNSEVA